MDFRHVAGKRLQWLDTAIEKHFSNFLYVDRFYASNPVLRRIFSQARKHGYRSLVVDEITASECALLAKEDAALAIRRTDFERSEVHRIAFFKCAKDQQPAKTDFIGYVIFKRDFFRGSAAPSVHVFESVMGPVRQEEHNNFLHCQRTYEVTTSIGIFAVTGVLYAQQNDKTFVCAHVGLRTALACILPEADITYDQINALSGVDHKTRQVGTGRGLEPKQIEDVITGVGLHFDKVVHEPNKQLNLQTEYQRDLYGAIESGFPALVGFEMDDGSPGAAGGPRHVIPVFGHTFNEDTWLPQANQAYFGGKLSYYPSEHWLSTFVVHDDNFGPYMCLPRHFLKKDNFRVLYGLKKQSTEFNSVQAEAIGFAFLNALAQRRPRTGDDWYDRFSVFATRGWLVLRTLLVKKQDYLGHLALIRDWNETPLDPALLDRFKSFLPQTFWLVEASAPELFNASRRKFGEVLLTIDKPPTPLNISLLLAARLPGVAHFNLGQTALETVITPLKGHSALYKYP